MTKTSARKTGTMGKRTLTKKSGESDRQTISEMSWSAFWPANEGAFLRTRPELQVFIERAR
jgi:hypothetical protein